VQLPKNLFRRGIRGPFDVAYGTSAIMSGISKIGIGGQQFMTNAKAKRHYNAGKGAIMVHSGFKAFSSGMRHIGAGIGEVRYGRRSGRGQQLGHPFYGNQYTRVAPRGVSSNVPQHLRQSNMQVYRNLSRRRSTARRGRRR
jgi:hypothetical protein